MTVKRKVQIVIDVIMTVLLPVLMSYSLIGEAIHEWAGIAMFMLVLLHHGLNWKWHKNLLHGKYSGLRILGIAVNTVISLLMLALMISGIVMSRHVFSFLGLDGGASLARTVHLVASYWCYVLTAFHLGLHGSMLIGMLRKAFSIKAPSTVKSIVSKGSAVLIAGYGIYAFAKGELGAYMLLKTEFVFFDFSEQLVFFWADYLAIMALFAILGYYTSQMLVKANEKRGKHKRFVSKEQFQEKE